MAHENIKLPKHYETFIPILEALSNGKTIHYTEMYKIVRDTYYSNLSPELLNKTTKNGDNLLLNRIGWGKSYLKIAKMILQPKRGMVQISEKGQNVLKKGILPFADLLNDKDFREYQEARKEKTDLNTAIENDSATPEDLIDTGISSIETQVKNELLDKLKVLDPYYFEKVVLKLLKKMGYGEYRETAKSGDGGIDGIIDQDKLGIDKIYVQSKRYSDGKIHETHIRDFIGAMSGDTTKGIFVTTSSFDVSAIQKAQSAHHTIILIDGIKLTDLMYVHGVGVQVKNTYEVKQVDEDFFDEQ